MENQSFSRVVFDRNGKILKLTLNNEDKYKLFVPLKQVLNNLKKSVILYEDRYLYYHPVFNPFSLTRVFFLLFCDRKLDASTIAIQVARITNDLKYKNYRSRSIATNLLNSFENLLLSLKAKSIKVVVQKQNNCRLPFWKKWDLLKKKRNQKYFPEKHEFIMSKKLEKKELTIEEKYFKNGKLAAFPLKPDEQQKIYKIMTAWFEKGKKYTELQVNELIKSRIECRDNATLRRDLVDNHYLNRSSDGKEYWRVKQ